MAEHDITPGQYVMLVSSGSESASYSNLKSDLEKVVQESGKVVLEQANTLSIGKHAASSVDVILSGVAKADIVIHTPELLGEYLRLVKPNGKLKIIEPVLTEGTSTNNTQQFRTGNELKSTLKIAGWTDVSDFKNVVLSDEELKSLETGLGSVAGVNFVEISCKKPNFEVGASSQLKLNLKAAVAAPSTVAAAAVWTLDDDDMMEDDLIDSDKLLEPDDLKKPVAESLKVGCGTDAVGKKKACKNCSCGLADSMATENGVDQSSQPAATSSCGNCYLGDAFRCSSCPYLGMPAFKAGEKIQLSDRQLKADA